MMYPETMGGDGPIVESIQRVAADPFFDVLEVTRMQDPAVRQQVRDIADMAHMDLGFGSQPGILGNELEYGGARRRPAPTLRLRHQSVHRPGL